MTGRKIFLVTTALILITGHAARAENINAKAVAAADAETAPATPIAKRTTVISTPAPTVTVTQTTPNVTTIGNSATATATSTATTTTTTTTVRETGYALDGFDKVRAGELDPAEFNAYTEARWTGAAHDYLEPSGWTRVTTWYAPGQSAGLQDFSYWDKNKDGRLDTAEMNTMLAQTGLYAAWDANHDGVVDDHEYAMGLFRLADRNGDGVIDKTEWLGAPH